MINWFNIGVISGSLGALIGLIDGIYNIVKDNELLLSPLDTVFFTLFAVILYSISFILIAFIITLIISLLKAIFTKKFTWEISTSNLMGLLTFITYSLFFGFWVNIKFLPELTSSKSIIGNLIILAVGIILWVLAFRIVNFYKNWIKQPKKFFFRFISVLYGIGIVVLIALLFQGTDLNIKKSSPPPNSMNLILVTIDTLRADHLGCYDNTSINTPNIDSLASDGVLFKKAYCSEPLTGPSHATILTSLYPRQHSVIMNGFTLPDGVETISEILAERGFNTGAFVGAFPVGSKLNFSQGFYVFNDYFSPLISLSRLTLLKILNHLHIISTKGIVQRKAEDVTDPFLSWLMKQGDNPFFAWVHYFDPHTPYDPPDEYRKNEDYKDKDEKQKSLYKGEIEYVDSEIGRIVEVLQDKMLMDDTIIVITADHGESLGEHDYYYDHGRFLYEPSLHIPLIIYSPNLKNYADNDIEQTVSTIDFAPTILDMLDITPPNYMEGESLLPVISGKEHLPYIYCETYEENWELIGILSDNWKLINNKINNDIELYNLSDDPGEVNDLSGKGYIYEKELLRLLINWDDLQPHKMSSEMTESDKQKLKTIGYF